MIVVAGGTGRLGTLVVRRLADRGLDVRVLTRDPARAAHLDGVPLVVGDVTRPATLAPAVEGADTVVSAVQGFIGRGKVSPTAVDRDGNAHLIDAAERAGAAIVLLSVIGASPDAAMELFRMKCAAEQHLRTHASAWTIVRASAFLETWTELLRQTAGRAGRPVVFGRGDNPINFVSVADVAAVVERAVTDPATRGTTIEVAGPTNPTLNELAAATCTGAPRHVPRPLLHLMARALPPMAPQLARQAAAALAMDTTELAVYARGARTR